MDALLEAKNDMLTKLNKLEEFQHGIVQDVDELKQSLRDSQQKIEEKADRIETAVLMRRIEDLKIGPNATTLLFGAWKKAARELTPQWKNLLALLYSKV